MLSLLGSIQPDPLSPKHKPNIRTSPSLEAGSETNNDTVHTGGDNEEEESGEDTFHALGQMVETRLKRGGNETRNDEDEGPPIKKRQKQFS